MRRFSLQLGSFTNSPRLSPRGENERANNSKRYSKNVHPVRIFINQIQEGPLASILTERDEALHRCAPEFRPLLELCPRVGGANCADAQDKMFGLHGLTKPCCTEAVPVNYSFLSFRSSMHFFNSIIKVIVQILLLNIETSSWPFGRMVLVTSSPCVMNFARN
jgi:hypothetical protein